MILESPSIHDNNEASTSAALSIAQLLKFNCIKHKHKHKQATPTIRHSIDQETPVPIYIGLMLHAHSCKRDLVDRLYSLGMSISYDHVLRLTAQMGSSVCEKFHRELAVCPRKLRYQVFTSAAVDNADHNSTSTKSKDAFHGTSISLNRHPPHNGAGVDRSISFAETSVDGRSKAVDRLPHFSTDVPPVNGSIKISAVSTSSVTSLKRDGFKQQVKNDYLWFDHIKHALEGEIDILEDISWAAYHASRQSPEGCEAICPTALLPPSLNQHTQWQ